MDVLTAKRRVIDVATRHRRRAMALSVLGFVGCCAVGALVAADVGVPAHIVGRLFALFMGLWMFGWGAVLVSSWFAPPLPAGFFERAFRASAAVFLVMWCSVAIALIVSGAAMLIIAF